MSQTTRIDFAAINRIALSQARTLVPGWLPQGKAEGREWCVGSLQGEPGGSCKINLDTGMWSDFEKGQSGNDLIGLFAAMKGITNGEAARLVGLQCGGAVEPGNVVQLPPKVKVAPADEWEPILPVPEDAEAPPTAHMKHGAPTHIARYADRHDQTLGYIYRCEPVGGKQIVSLTWCRNTVTPSKLPTWRWKSLPKPRSLYRMEMLDKLPNARVVMVEGERKCDDASLTLEDDRTMFMSWAGGSNAVQYADWSLLAGRDVIIWPDNDAAGFAAADAAAVALRHHGCTVRVITPPKDKPKAWDIGDAVSEGMNGHDIMAIIDPPLAVPAWDGPPPDYEMEIEAPGGSVKGPPFYELGHDKGRFYFYTVQGGQVRDFTAPQLQILATLFELAPHKYWTEKYMAKGELGFDIKKAAGELMMASYARDTYDPEMLRGRGAWFDDGRTVMHLGHCILVDGKSMRVPAFRSDFVYEQGKRMDVAIGAEPLSTKRAARLLELCKACPWEKPESMGRFLAGWLVIAPICGAMPWRPHIWITGEAGSGKTHIIELIVRPVVGPIGLPVASKTSEAGLRGDLGIDARPVIFDEFESQNEQDRQRVQQILDLARQASSEEGAPIVKGTQTGGSRRYRIRSCFAFSSINVGMQQTADESRTVVLSVKPHKDAEIRRERYAALLALEAEVLTPDFQSGLLARSLALLPIIRANVEVFARAIHRAGHSRRTGDTLGALLAGAWSLRSTLAATIEEADKFVAEQMGEALQSVVGDDEWKKAINVLIQIPLRTPVNGSHAFQDITIGELIDIADSTSEPDSRLTTPDMALQTMGRAGIRLVKDAWGTYTHVLVANSGRLIQQGFAREDWGPDWKTTLARAPGAEKIGVTTFAHGLSSRGVKIPIKLVQSPNEI